MTSNYTNQPCNKKKTSIVNPGSVQSQFASIAQDKDTLRKKIASADRDRRIEEAKIQKLRAVESSLNEKIRVAHTKLGTETKKREILKQEEARLKKMLSNDRAAIGDFADQMKSIVIEEREKKEIFVVRS